MTPNDQRTVKLTSADGAALVALAESFLQMEHKNREDPEERAKALNKAEQWRAPIKLTSDHRTRFIQHPNAFESAAPRAPHERWYGFEYERARAVGFDVYDELEKRHGREKVRCMTARELDAAVWRFRAEGTRPDLFRSAEEARNLTELAAAVKQKHPHATGVELNRLMFAANPGAFTSAARVYGLPVPTPEVVQLAAQAHASEQQWYDDAIDEWRARHGSAPTQQQRGKCFDEYAHRHRGRVPENIKSHFRIAPTETTTVPGPARDPLTARELLADVASEQRLTAPQAAPDPRIAFAMRGLPPEEREALNNFVRQALHWWTVVKNGDVNDRLSAIRGFADEFPWLVPSSAVRAFDLPDPVEAVQRNLREAVPGKAPTA